MYLYINALHKYRIFSLSDIFEFYKHHALVEGTKLSKKSRCTKMFIEIARAPFCGYNIVGPKTNKIQYIVRTTMI